MSMEVVILLHFSKIQVSVWEDRALDYEVCTISFTFTAEGTYMERLTAPIATSTPRVNSTTQNGYADHLATQGHEEASGKGGLTTIRESITSEGTAVSVTVTADTQRSSSSSELTHISTTDVSSHADESEHAPLSLDHSLSDTEAPAPAAETQEHGTAEFGESQKSVALSDVVVSVGSSTLVDTTTVSLPNGPLPIRPDSSGSDEAPPLPSSPPPGLGEEGHWDVGPPPPPSSLPPDIEDAEGTVGTHPPSLCV